MRTSNIKLHIKPSLILISALLTLSGLSCQKEISTSPEEVLIPKILMFVDSDPPGARIFVDGRYMGQRTPDTIKWLEKGNHLVTLKNKLLKDSSIVINISGDTSVFFNYYTNPTMRGNLYCDSNPRGAEIFINDSSTALTTPNHFKGLFPAEYKVRYKLPGYWDSKAKASVVSERTVTVDINLPDSTVWVNYTVSNLGLPADTYNDIDIQEGYIKWFASEGGGLIKYIGDTIFTVYNTGNSNIPSNKVKSVKAADNGVWIATDKGAAFFSNGIFTIYNSTNSPVSDTIDCIAPLPGGKVWLGSANKGVFYFNGINWINYHKENAPLRNNHIRSIFIDANGIVWIGTVEEGLVLYDGLNWLWIYNALPSPRVEAINVTNSEVWVGTAFQTRMVWNGYEFIVRYFHGGLSQHINNTWTKFKDAGEDIVAIAKDIEGNLWFSDFLTGLGKKSANGFQKYGRYNKINGIAIDASGNKWMSTAEKGIIKYKGN